MIQLDDGGKDFDRMFEQATNMQKTMIKRFWPLILVQGLLSICGLIAVVYGILWCLKHFSVI